MSPSPPPGWYTASDLAPRHWDGTKWTDDEQAVPARNDLLESEIMLAETRRSLDGQRGDFNSLRSRTSTLLGISGLILPLASTTSANVANSVFSLIALAAFIIGVGYAAYVLWPHTMTFEVKTQELFLLQERAESTEHYQRSLAWSIGSYRDQNVPVMEGLTAAYMATAVFVGLEVIALSLGAVIG